MQFSRLVRLDEGAHLLGTTEQLLSDIAPSTGFCDQSAFTKDSAGLRGHTASLPAKRDRHSLTSLRKLSKYSGLGL